VQRLIEWPPRYQLMQQCCGAICSMGALSINVPRMQLPLETLTLMGLSASKDYLLMARLNALYTQHAWITRDLGVSLISGCLTGNWYDFWGPPYVAQHYYQTPMSDVWCLSLAPMMEEYLNPLENCWWSCGSSKDAHGQGSPWRWWLPWRWRLSV